jgi:hypothetical protein
LECAQFYANELDRREAVRQGERMEALTKSLNRLTWAIATFIGVASLRGPCSRTHSPGPGGVGCLGHSRIPGRE